LFLCTLGEDLKDLGVELVSLREGIDTRTATGRALFGMCAVFAQLEADLIRDRTRAGLAAAKRRGKQLGRPRALRSADVKRVKRLRASGHTIRQIASQLAVGRSTVSRALEG
jgi:DNA invertase Pin-like site-specific DNA recombinase